MIHCDDLAINNLHNNVHEGNLVLFVMAIFEMVTSVKLMKLNQIHTVVYL